MLDDHTFAELTGLIAARLVEAAEPVPQHK